MEIVREIEEKYGERIKVIGPTGHIYIQPVEYIEQKGQFDDTVAQLNAVTGIQWYKAECFERLNYLNEQERRDLLINVFGTHGLVSLANLVETQIDIKHLTESMLHSLNWSKWELDPGVGDVGEQLHLSYMGLRVILGNNEEEWRVGIYKGPKLSPQMVVLENGEEWHYEYDEEAYLPDFDIREINVKGSRVEFEGLPTDSPYKEDQLTPSYKRRRYKYVYEDNNIFGVEGDYKFDEWEYINKILETADRAKSSVHFDTPADPDVFKWGEIKSIIENDQFRLRSLATFLLPYCDNPSASGIHYVLPEG